MGLSLNWHDGGGEGPAQMRAVMAAALAVAAGLARHVLVYRTVTEGSAQGTGGRQGIGVPSGGGGVPRFGGFMQWSLPFGAASAANWLAMIAPAPRARVRPDPRADGPDRAQRAPQRRAEPQGRLHGADVDGRLPGGAHDHDAAVPLRLRRPVRRLDGGHRLAPRRRRRPGPPGRGHQRPRHGVAGAAELGPVRRHDVHGGP